MKEPSRVSPIPQAFDLASERDPAITLLASDGNHSTPAGAFLASLVLYDTLTGLAPIDLPNLSGFSVDADAKLKCIAN